MKICRLKIIRANILENNIDTPKIAYVSESKTNKKNEDSEFSNIKYMEEKIEFVNNIEEVILSKENTSNHFKLQDIIKSERDQEIDDNEKNLIEEDKNEELENIIEYDLKNSYPYAIMNKRKDLNNSLRYIFKNRITKDKSNSKTNSKKNSNLSLPKIRHNNLFNSKNKNYYNRTKLPKSVSNSINYKTRKFKNKNSKRIKNNLSTNLEESNNSIFSRVVEKSEINYLQNEDYKALIDDLIIEECNLVKKKEEIIQLYEEKIKSLKELNENLISKKNFSLNREDELNGEFILLRNKYETLFRNFKQKFKINDDKFNKKQNEIDESMKKLNIQLKNGEILLVTKPNNIIKLSKEENKHITFLLSGLFFGRHILDTDKIIDLIWKFDKQIQTIYFLVNELMNLFNLNDIENKNILINYIYSFCKNNYYMDINEFKFKFKTKIGKIKLYNKYIQLSKLLNCHKRETKSLISLIGKKESKFHGIINFTKFKQLFYDIAFSKNMTKDEEDETLEFFIYCMKKNCDLKIKTKNKKEEEKKYISLYDLFYQNLKDFVDEYNAKVVPNSYELIRNYMEKHNIVSSEKLLRPIIIPENIIKKDGKDYIDEIILNKFLRHLNIIKKDEKLCFPTFEEELIDINELINDIYTKTSTSNNKLFDNNIEKVNNMLDDIFYKLLDNNNGGNN